MAYRQVERQQRWLFPESLDEYISREDPVRAYDAFVDALDVESLGIEWDPHKVGCPQYDPKVMLKILVYGYSYGIRSSRKLERALYHNLSFIWLAGALKPDHKTIAEFRRRNRKALKHVLKQCARLCIELDLIAGNTLFVDGSKFRGNVSLNNLWTPERCEKYLARIDRRIDEILAECDCIDEQEADDGSLVELKEELESKQKLKAKVETALEKLRTENLERFNTTDPESARIHGRQGSHAGYNAQIVVDDRHGLIVHSDVVNDNNDLGQFANQVEQANETLEEPCKAACADAGYSNAGELQKVDAQGIRVIVPSSKQASGKSAWGCLTAEAGPFDKGRFRYVPGDDVYICPEGIHLPYRRLNSERGQREYYPGRGVCSKCKHFGVCTKNVTTGRKIIRYENETVREKLAAQYEQSQEIYSCRKEKAELPFGHIKRNLGVDSFLLRSLAGVRAEMSVLATCFNMARLISLFGVSGLVGRFMALVL
jgi:transposase